MHCGRTAAEHGQDALQVEELQELVPTGESDNNNNNHQPISKQEDQDDKQSRRRGVALPVDRLQLLTEHRQNCHHVFTQRLAGGRHICTHTRTHTLQLRDKHFSLNFLRQPPPLRGEVREL